MAADLVGNQGWQLAGGIPTPVAKRVYESEESRGAAPVDAHRTVRLLELGAA